MDSPSSTSLGTSSTTNPPSHIEIPLQNFPQNQFPIQNQFVPQPLPTFCQPLTIKLDQDNYLLWKNQLLNVIIANGLEEYIDGTLPTPPRFLDLQHQLVNPQFRQWERMNRLLMSWFYSSLAERMIGRIVGLTTASEIWNTLERIYAATSQSCLLEQRTEIRSIKEGLTVDEYVLKHPSHSITMADPTTSSFNLSTESNQVGAEDATEIEITNQAAAADGNLTQITFMDRKLYEAAADGDSNFLKAREYDILDQLTPKKNTVLHVAAQFGQADCVKEILQLTSLSSLLQQPNEKGDTPLHLAAREGHLTVVKNLIDAAKGPPGGDAEGGAAADCKEMLTMTNEVQDAALHEAVRNHHPEVVKLLIQEDPEFIYGANAEGNTPLYIAAEWGFGDLVQMILDKCSSPAHSGIKRRTALHAAVILNDQAMTKKILDKKPALTKELDENGWSPLHFAACVGCHPTIVTQLLEKSDRYVVYLGVEYHKIGNRTALHIAASRGHVDIVKLLVTHFPDCCEKVDDEGNNVLHLIMPKRIIFSISGLSYHRWLRVRGLMNEKNVEGKAALHLWDGPRENIFIRLFVTFVKLTDRSRSFRLIRPLGSLEVKEDIDSSESKENEQISEMKKTIQSHLVVAALVAAATFTAGFTLPGGYIQDGSNSQGMAVLSLPTNGTDGKDRDMAIGVRKSFTIFVAADRLALILSMLAICCYFLGALPFNKKKAVRALLHLGSVLTLCAMITMLLAFSAGLEAVLHHSSLLEDIKFVGRNFMNYLVVPAFVIAVFNDPDFVWKKFVSLVRCCKSF